MILFLVSVFTSYFSAMDIFRSDFKEKREITLPSEKKNETVRLFYSIHFAKCGNCLKSFKVFF